MAGDAKLSIPYKIIIVDDELISRGFMEMLVKPMKNYQIEAALPYAKDLILWCDEHQPPDLVIMDVMMEKGVDGLTAAAKLKQKYPQTKIILATSMVDTAFLNKAKDAGIESFWFKTCAEISLTDVMNRTMAGESIYPEDAPSVMLGDLPANELTPQQRNLLRLMIDGLSNREIGEKMYISQSTVKAHLDELMRRTGIHSRISLVAKASRLGVVVSDAERLGNQNKLPNAYYNTESEEIK